MTLQDQMNSFEIKRPFEPAGDQPKAIASLCDNLKNGLKYQTLLGVTGSGKTFTLANVIQDNQKPTLVIAHNKTLAAQLASEFREFFPNNAVHYFVSYYDYYQPEAYIPTTDTYIEKDSSINDEIDRLRNAATQALMTRKDVIIVASVSCIYGLGSPEIYRTAAVPVGVGDKISRSSLVRRLSDVLYERNDYELSRGKFRVKGDSVEIFPSYDEIIYRIDFFANDIESISQIDPITGSVIDKPHKIEIFPARHFLADQKGISQILDRMESDLDKEVAAFKKAGKLLEAQRLQERTSYDIELIRETGFCNGIENYSRYFDQRDIGTPPSVLLDYFPSDFLMILDESHMTVPQIRGMYNGDQARKKTLIDFGFRLNAAKDNRPLKFEEFMQRINQVIFTSATPSEFEIELSKSQLTKPTNYRLPSYVRGYGRAQQATSYPIVEQIIRPTGLVDPKVTVKPVKDQVDDLLAEIQKRVAVRQRVLVTTLTKRLAEDLTDYLKEIGIKVQYLHSDVDTLDRIEILQDLRLGKYDVLVGINLLREGLDLPEVSLVAILDADREGFLRNATSLIQTFGRAARHLNGEVIMYAESITRSMQQAIDETDRRRKIQVDYNIANNITPISINKSAPIKATNDKVDAELVDYRSIPKDELRKVINRKEAAMIIASKNLEFERAADLRDEISYIKKYSKK